MNRFVLAFLCVTALSSFANASYDSSLSSNRTPKQASIWTSACDECQIIIKRIVAVAKDPTKLGELKALLSLLCRETSYQEECRLFVSNIDRFIQELLPYMKDAHATCQKLHICSNTKLQQLHRVGLLYAKKYLNKLDGANDLICEECEFAAHELQLYVESKSNQEKIKSFLEDEVCAHLGQQLHGPCNEMVEVFLPDLFNELKDMLKDNHQFCQQLALCPSSNTAVVPSSKTIKKHDSSVGSLNRLVKQITQLSAYKGTLKVNMGCLECRLAMDALLFELQRNSTVHKLAKEIRHTLCPILPNSYHEGCDDFLRLYASTIVYMTFKQFDSQSVCTTHIFALRKHTEPQA
uniref:Saposin B-type domain-containing protein n=1 Tax=Ditylenchus dipsaci TaxID=166011 RepID=A0A915DAE8_9BILA